MPHRTAWEEAWKKSLAEWREDVAEWERKIAEHEQRHAGRLQTLPSLLEPFELEADLDASLDGQLRTAGGLPSVPVRRACPIRGGEAWAWVGEEPVAATVRHGAGTITVTGLAHRFCDAEMGVLGDVEPNEALREVFELQFRTVEAIVEDRLPSEASATPSPDGEKGVP